MLYVLKHNAKQNVMKYFVTVFKWLSQISVLYLSISMIILFISDNFLLLLPAF